MKDFFYRHHWTFLILLFSVYAGFGFGFRECAWINAWLQTGAIAITIVFSVILMIRSNKKSDDSTQFKLQFYQQQTEKHISAIQVSNETQITVIRASTKDQIDKLQEFTKLNIKALESSVKSQIDHQSSLSEKHLIQSTKETERILKGFTESTEREIESFVQQTLAITDKLEDIVEHLAAISADNKEMLENEKRLREIEEQKIQFRNQQLTELLHQQQRVIDNYKPALQFYLENEGIFFIDLKFVIHNSGGEATSIKLAILFSDSSGIHQPRRFNKVLSDLRRGHEKWFHITRSKKLKMYDRITIRADVWDVNQNHYSGTWIYTKELNRWFDIEIEGQNLIT
jgi:hypothetical protein